LKLVANFASGIVDTVAKFAIDINKFSASVIDIGGAA
jgi:hypothetical protein